MGVNEFAQGLNCHFSIKQPRHHNYIETHFWCMYGVAVLDVIGLDDLLHERFGNYEEERGMSMKELIEAEYGQIAVDWVETAMLLPHQK